MNDICFVERLRWANLLFQFCPLLLRRQLHQIFVIDAKPFVLWFAKKTGNVFGVLVEKMEFKLIQIKDENDLLLRLRIAFGDLGNVCNNIQQSAAYRGSLARLGVNDAFRFYFQKSLATFGPYARLTLWRALLLVHVARHQMKKMGREKCSCFLFIDRRPWMREIQQYGEEEGVVVQSLLPVLQWDPRKGLLADLFRQGRIVLWHLKNGFLGRGAFSNNSAKKPASKLLLQCQFHLNLNRPGIFSELFFWQQSKMAGSDILVSFHIPKEPLDSLKLKEMRQYGMGPIILDPRATKIKDCPPFLSRPPIWRGQIAKNRLDKTLSKQEKKWFSDSFKTFERSKKYWSDLFKKFGVKIFVSWFRYDGEHCVIADALGEVDGILAIYQRALDTRPSSELAIFSEISFGYSRFSAQIEKESGSEIPYFVVTGYLGDHRFPLLKAEALCIRGQLQKNGAKKILSYTDEGSGDDSRWHTGHENMRDHYAFLLEKLLSTPDLGLVLKPKVPSTLRRRLGNVASLLAEAEKTGRCHLFEEGAVHGHYPPAIAALAADVAIHGHLCAPTAGLDCALTKVPTLLLDREGWSVSPLCQLGVGDVVFKNWESLWEAYTDYQKNPVGFPKFGNWSGMLEQLDPFRDGRAAERMGTYLDWLLDGYKQGKSKKETMAQAAERYAEIWGADKIISIENRH